MLTRLLASRQAKTACTRFGPRLRRLNMLLPNKAKDKANNTPPWCSGISPTITKTSIVTNCSKDKKRWDSPWQSPRSPSSSTEAHASCRWAA